MRERTPGVRVLEAAAREQESDRWLTTSHLADRYNTTDSTVRYWRHIGYGPPGHKIGRRVMYRESDVQAWERDQVMRGGAA